MGGLNETVTAADAGDQAGFYLLGDGVAGNGLATEFCAIGKVNTEEPSNTMANITGRLIFFVVRASAAEEDTSEDEIVYSIVERVAVAYRTSQDLTQANGIIVRNCTQTEIEVEEGDRVVVFIYNACIGRICPLQVNFIGDGDYGVELFEGSDRVFNRVPMPPNDEVESVVLQNQLISINDTFLNVQITIESGTIHINVCVVDMYR